MRDPISAVFAARLPRLAVAASVWLLCTLQLQAQPNLQLTRVWTAWPRIDVHFRVECQGVHRVDMRKDQVRLFDDGREITDFTLFTPPAAGKPFSCALLFDASGSMAGSYNAGAKTAGHAFIDQMDGVQDEAAVLWFTESLHTDQAMTTRSDLLHAAVDRLPASGGTAFWDAAYEAIMILDTAASHACRSIILLTDGVDNTSTSTVETIVNAANLRGIRVNVIGMGYNHADLLRAATLTGGKYFYTVNPAELAPMYRELFTDLRFCYSECMVSYLRGCADGSLFSLDLRIEHFCNGTDDVQQVLRAPLDIRTFKTLDMSLGDAYVQGGNDLHMTVWLQPPVDSTQFQPFSVPLNFDTTVLRLKAVTAPPGALLNGVPISITPRADGALITAQAKKWVLSSGPLMELHFATRAREDTLRTVMTLGDISFQSGCLRSFSTDAAITLFPAGPMPLVYCESLGPSRLQWDRMQENYLPNPFAVMARFLNTGSVAAKEARFVLSYDSSVLRLRQPLQDTIVYAFADIDPGSHAAVSWDLETPLRFSDGGTDVCITALFDNHQPVQCCSHIEIPRADGILQCSIAVPEIRANTATGRYEPMPFPVTVRVANVGGRAADNVSVRLQLPSGMELAAPDAPAEYQKTLSMNPLLPGASDTLRWMLQHPVVAKPTTPTLHVTAQSSSTGASSCTYEVPIPGLDLSTFHFSLIANGPLTFCEGDSVVLDASSGREAWQWNTGDSTRRITVRKGGTYFCSVIDGGRSGYSDTVQVRVLPAPHPRIAVTGSLPLCDGDTITLDAGEGYRSYRWNTGDSTRLLRVHQAGWYVCEVRNENDCRGRSDSLHVDTAARPDAPRIQRQGDLLTTTTAEHYQWYRDGVPIEDSDNQFLAIVATGNYRVRITDASGCSAWSEPFEVTVLDVAPLPPTVHSFDAFPNPARDHFTVVLSLASVLPVDIVVTDVLGRVLYRCKEKGNDAIRLEVNLERQPAGLYFIRAQSRAFTIMRKITLRR